MARNYSIYEAKAHLSKLLRIVKQGHTVTVSERGKPVAKVIPISEGESALKRLKNLEECGLLIRAKSKTFPKGTKVLGGLERFLEDR